MSLNWKNLRPYNGSQQNAFEELCCQLARYEQMPQGSKFVRKGTPDGGVECYWTLPSGDEVGWQAKFFQSSPTSSQWGQVDESVKTALEKHPRLMSYTICMATDLSDARLDGQESAQQKWDARVGKWKGWAENKGLAVEFSFWGSHHISERLSRDEHRGRTFFWFHEECLSQKWFEEHTEIAVANAGPRYTPVLNIELPIARIFESLGYTSSFKTEIKRILGRIRRAYARVERYKNLEEIADKIVLVGKSTDQILRTLSDMGDPGSHSAEIDDFKKCLTQVIQVISDCQSVLRESEKKKPQSSGVAKGQTYHNYGSRKYDEAEPDFQILKRELEELDEFNNSSEMQLANKPALLLKGHAGTGKTHLFCDIAEHRVKCKMPTVLLLGQQFVDHKPWSQIIEMLGLSCGKDEFLGALQAAAQAQDSRALILIDALNEGAGEVLWSKYLAGILTELSRYPWIGIALSVRSSYERDVIPPDLVPDIMVAKQHPGFAENEYQAAKTFFDHYHIEYPSVPIFSPEFQNPLFLKLFCQGMQNRGLTRIPPGLHGITAVFSFFIESLNDKLHRQEYLDFDPHKKIVQRAVDVIVSEMSEHQTTYLSYETAERLVNGLLSTDGYEKSLLRHLISEGLLSIDMDYEQGEEPSKCIRFAYERFADHMLVGRLLDQHLCLDHPEESFLDDAPLGLIIKDEATSWQNVGLIEAILIQVPERINRELTDVAPQCADFDTVQQCFVESLIWRKRDAFTDSTLRYINDRILKYQETADQFLNALLTVAMDPEHPFNADFLDKQWQRLPMAERDAWWSIFLHRQCGNRTTVDRLVDWAWSTEDKSHVLDESVRLCGTTLIWFLTTSNRYLRDRATKALVALFTPWIGDLRKLMPKFLDVDDPYVTERLLAAAYGCAMRSSDNKAVAGLAQDVYGWIFGDGTPPPHILLRDYARGVIEIALHRKLLVDIDLKKIRPPYKSEWLEKNPTEDTMEVFRKIEDGAPRRERSRWRLYDSVMGYGDFARYIIGTNHSQGNWSSQRLGEPNKPSRRTYRAFEHSLTARQERKWKSYLTLRQNIAEFKKYGQELRKAELGYSFTDEQLDDVLLRATKGLSTILGKKKTKVLNELVLPYLDHPNEAEDHFDFAIMQHWIFQRVLELGWSVDLFGEFDSSSMDGWDYRHPRTAHKPERIGKKYQWIAYHELLARLSDNFKFKDDLMSNEWDTKYDGPWQLHRRDIDPSSLLQVTQREAWNDHSNTWWFQPKFSAWPELAGHAAWIKDSELPAFQDLVAVSNPADGTEWFCLDAFYRWMEAAPPEEDQYEKPHGQISVWLHSCIVKKKDANYLFEWLKNQSLINIDPSFPELPMLLCTFEGEFFWSPAYSYEIAEGSGQMWVQPSGLPRPVIVPGTIYLNENTRYDCSVDDDIRIYLPSKHLVNGLGLNWSGNEGCFQDAEGKLAIFDPSVREKGPGALLVRRDLLTEYLQDNELDILWTINGRKNLVGGTDQTAGESYISVVCRVIKDEIKHCIHTRLR